MDGRSPRDPARRRHSLSTRVSPSGSGPVPDRGLGMFACGRPVTVSRISVLFRRGGRRQTTQPRYLPLRVSQIRHCLLRAESETLVHSSCTPCPCARVDKAHRGGVVHARARGSLRSAGSQPVSRPYRHANTSRCPTSSVPKTGAVTSHRHVHVRVLLVLAVYRRRRGRPGKARAAARGRAVGCNAATWMAFALAANSERGKRIFLRRVAANFVLGRMPFFAFSATHGFAFSIKQQIKDFNPK